MITSVSDVRTTLQLTVRRAARSTSTGQEFLFSLVCYALPYILTHLETKTKHIRIVPWKMACN